MKRPRARWVPRYRYGRWYACHTTSRVMYPADDQEHAGRLAQSLNLGTRTGGAWRLLADIFRRGGG